MPSEANILLLAALIVFLFIAVACSLITAPRPVVVQQATPPPQVATMEAQPELTPTPFTAAEVTAEPSETPLPGTPEPVSEQIATARPALEQVETAQPAPEQTATAEPAAETAPPPATKDDNTPEPVPVRATFVASRSEFKIDHAVASGSTALLYVTLRPDREAYFDGSDFKLQLPGAADSSTINGRSEGTYRLPAGESIQRIVQFDIPPDTPIAGGTLRWSYHDRP